MAQLGFVEGAIRDKRILVVDDEKALAIMVGSVLGNAGFRFVHSCASPVEALELLRQNQTERQFDLFVLDVMMPEMDGYELLSSIRAHPLYENTPAIFLTAKDEPIDRISGLMIGADDYIGKPFVPQELVLRIAALLRRSYPESQNIVNLKGAVIDFSTAEVRKEDGTVSRLTAKELQILETLARNAGRIVTIDTLCETCWDSSFGQENALMAHIRRIREKIVADPSSPVSLITVKGLGYRLNLEEDRSTW